MSAKLPAPERHAGCAERGELIPLSRQSPNGSRYDEIKCLACGSKTDWTYTYQQRYAARLRLTLKRRLLRVGILVRPDSSLAFDYLRLRAMCAHHNLLEEEETHGNYGGDMSDQEHTEQLRALDVAIDNILNDSVSHRTPFVLLFWPTPDRTMYVSNAAGEQEEVIRCLRDFANSLEAIHRQETLT